MKLLAHFMNFLGNTSYALNGGLEHLNNNSRLDRLATYFWSKAYGLFEKSEHRI
jgi:hypothetical protein